MVYAIEFKEIYEHKFLVKADSLEEAKEKVNYANQYIGIDLGELTSVIIDGYEAELEDKKDGEWLEV